MSRFALLFPVVLAACTLDTVAPADRRAEPVLVDVAASGTVDPGTGYSVAFESASDVMTVTPFSTPCVGCLDQMEQRVLGMADASCPSITHADGGLVVEGECTTEGNVTFSGRFALRNVDGARISAFEGFAIHDPTGGFDFEADGSYRVAGTTDGADYAFNLTYTWHDGSSDDGVFAYDMDITEADGVRRILGEVSVENGYVNGTFAVESTMSAVEACEVETSGSIALLGANEAVLTLDGGKSCDGCGELSIDGGAPVKTCR